MHERIAPPMTEAHARSLASTRSTMRCAGIIGRDNVIAGTDCGFAQSPFAQRVHPSIMWAKLRALVDGARLASAELWGKQSAASSVRRRLKAGNVDLDGHAGIGKMTSQTDRS
jgi:hypothetical protein